ncbi:MAG: dockerin type I domain-containing protein [Gammaproteobacteria bacterium]
MKTTSRRLFLLFAAVGMACSAASASATIDTDGDGVLDYFDNCSEVANPGQLDTNGDGFGNICDADLNNDDIVNFIDLTLFNNAFLTTDPDADFNGDGFVNFLDLALFQTQFLMPPGPGAVEEPVPDTPTLTIESDEPFADFDGNIVVNYPSPAASFNLKRIRVPNIVTIITTTEDSNDQTNLPSGEYTYSVQACNSQGACSAFSEPVFVSVGLN